MGEPATLFKCKSCHRRAPPPGLVFGPPGRSAYRRARAPGRVAAEVSGPDAAGAGRGRRQRRGGRAAGPLHAAGPRPSRAHAVAAAARPVWASAHQGPYPGGRRLGHGCRRPSLGCSTRAGLAGVARCAGGSGGGGAVPPNLRASTRGPRAASEPRAPPALETRAALAAAPRGAHSAPCSPKDRTPAACGPRPAATAAAGANGRARPPTLAWAAGVDAGGRRAASPACQAAVGRRRPLGLALGGRGHPQAQLDGLSSGAYPSLGRWG